jgi:hypothetical protein
MSLNNITTINIKSYFPRLQNIIDEVHLVRPGEWRKLDRPMAQMASVRADIPIKKDYQQFMVPKDTPTDKSGFVRVSLSYDYIDERT